jgi:ubiquinone biosynthesis monooxygenase Coq7
MLLHQSGCTRAKQFIRNIYLARRFVAALQQRIAAPSDFMMWNANRPENELRQLGSNRTMHRPIDSLLSLADEALRTVFARPSPTRPAPRPATADAPLSEPQRREAGALMRVNHVGEVCAQALYTAQAAATRDAALREHFELAAREETDHLAWTRQRLDELGAHPSLLNPLWYAGAFGLGLVAGRLGDRLSLGFVAETERQVEAHLDGHLDRLPAADQSSRAIVTQMKLDEARHAAQAWSAGAVELPAPARGLMRLASRVMTTVAHRI